MMQKLLKEYPHVVKYSGLPKKNLRTPYCLHSIRQSSVKLHMIRYLQDKNLARMFELKRN